MHALQRQSVRGLYLEFIDCVFWQKSCFPLKLKCIGEVNNIGNNLYFLAYALSLDYNIKHSPRKELRNVWHTPILLKKVTNQGSSLWSHALILCCVSLLGKFKIILGEILRDLLILLQKISLNMAWWEQNLIKKKYVREIRTLFLCGPKVSNTIFPDSIVEPLTTRYNGQMAAVSSFRIITRGIPKRFCVAINTIYWFSSLSDMLQLWEPVLKINECTIVLRRCDTKESTIW